MKRGGKYLICGGTGFLGQELIRNMVGQGFKNIVALARNEGGLVALKERFPQIEVIPGDIGDPFVCAKAMKGADGVFHLAAFKHVTMAEENVFECIHSNINGTINLLEQSRIVRPKFFVFISTDKASNLRGVYGVTKFLGERLISEYARLNRRTNYRTIRYGNVWGSTGSFITKWEPLIKAGKEIVITDPQATRFFFTVKDAVDLIFNALEHGKDEKPIIPKMKSITIGMVAQYCMDLWGKCPVKIIGLQPGENQHETIDGWTYSNEVDQYTEDEFKEKFLK